MEGYIKLHRSILEWEWWHDINVYRVFSYLLMKANHKAKQWRGVSIKRGQLITSLPSLEKQTGLSCQQIRTALNKLKSTGEITEHATNKYRLITLANYCDYQGTEKDSNRQKNTQSNRQVTDNQQASNRQVTANKNVKNDKKEKNTYQGRDFSAQIIKGLDQWFQYKKERRESYKPTGLTSFLNTVESKLKASSEQGIIEVINESMANGYRGVTWNKLQKQDKVKDSEYDDLF